MSKLTEFFFRPPERPLTDAQRWGLVAGGLLTEINDGGYDSLWFPFGRSKSKQYLRDGWDTVDQDDLNRIHDWLVREGHRVSCAAICQHVREMQLGLAPYDANDPHIELYRWVADNLTALETSQLVAWDYTRLVNVARWGYTSGLIDQKVAWKWIFEAAHALQRSYSNWAEIGEDFLLGFSFWANGKSPDDGFFDAHRKLTTAHNSPWRSIHWNQPLS